MSSVLRCGKCGAPRHELTDAVYEQLSRDREMAAAYRALIELAQRSRDEKTLAAEVRTLVSPYPLLEAWLLESNRILFEHRGRPRFRKHIRLWVPRRLTGIFRGLPEQLPPRRSVHDRVFPNWDTFEWVLVWGELKNRYWRPSEPYLTKRVVAAMLGVRESTLDVLMSNNDEFKRVDESEAPTRSEAWLSTDAVMSSRDIELQMRKYIAP